MQKKIIKKHCFLVKTFWERNQRRIEKAEKGGGAHIRDNSVIEI